MPDTMCAEWTKLRSTASFWWTSALILLIPVALAGVFAGFNTGNPLEFLPVSVVTLSAIPVLIIVTVQAAMTVTTDYRYGVPATTFRLTPVRWRVGVAKLVLYAVLAAVLVAVGLLLAFLLGDVVAGRGTGWTGNPTANRGLWALPLAAVLVTVFSQGLGWITRNTAGAVVLVFAFQFVLDSIGGLLPGAGGRLARYLPFSNLYAFLYDNPVAGFTVGASLGIFILWAAGLWIAGLVVLERRDV
ncbi:ABC transporter permease [Corynebacterium sp. UBA2622]|uniref:ABC transporter permease n=1 Tax=Corynebacterium sp. UBA2622 TaxID=1946393 RepID=UPI0025B88E81|nr:ABC transporter permease [Corynebacterium sp. UBA2622]